MDPHGEPGLWVDAAADHRNSRTWVHKVSPISRRGVFLVGYSTLVQMNSVALCLPVIGLLSGPVLMNSEVPSTLN